MNGFDSQTWRVDPDGWLRPHTTIVRPDPDPLDVTEQHPNTHWDSNGGVVLDPNYATPAEAFQLGREYEARRSSSKVVLLALGVGAALGFVAGWAAR